jgi:DNA-binding response OmpR family regulator
MAESTVLENMHVVLIDDDPSIRRSLEFYFRKRTASFVTFERAEEALHHLAENGCHIVISDYILPSMNGLELFRHIRHSHAAAMKVLITAYADMEVAVEAIRLGIHDFIRKPFKAKTIEWSLHSLVEKNKEGSRQVHVDGRNASETGDPQWAESAEFAISKVSHQINNCLQGVMGNAEMGLLAAGAGTDTGKRLGRILEDARRVHALNGRLQSAGRMIKEPAQAVDLQEIMESCLLQHREPIRVIGAEVKRRYQPQTVAYTKPHSLRQIFNNVLDNCIRALSSVSADQPPRLEVSIQRSDSHIGVRIRDNGTGMPERELGECTGKGFTKRPNGGGPELFIVERLCRDIGGEFEISNNEGGGTEYGLFLPANRNTMTRQQVASF